VTSVWEPVEEGFYVIVCIFYKTTYNFKVCLTSESSQTMLRASCAYPLLEWSLFYSGGNCRIVQTLLRLLLLISLSQKRVKTSEYIFCVTIVAD